MLRFSKYLSIVFLCCIALGVEGAFRNAAVSGQYYSIGNVEVVEWEPNRAFADKIVKEGKPVILRNTVVQQWPAREKWTPSYMAEHSPSTVLVSKQSTSRIFTYWNSKRPMNALFPKQYSHEQTRMNLTEFWKEPDILKREFRYYTGGLEVFDKFGLRSDLQPHLEWMGPADCQGRDDVLWMGCNGVTAQTHYDESHNFYTQIYGTKRFLLTPPKWIDQVYIFPWLHPSQRQSQVKFAEDVLPWSFEKEELEKAKNLAIFSGEVLLEPAAQIHAETNAPQVNLPCYEAELQAGDVLYLPPFWLHRVEAAKGFAVRTKIEQEEALWEDIVVKVKHGAIRGDSASISLSSWCDAQPERGVAARLLLRPLPIEKSWTLRVQTQALRFYLSALAFLWEEPSEAAKGITQSESPAQEKKIREFYGRMYRQHFSLLFGDEDGVLPFLKHLPIVQQVQSACQSSPAIPWKVWESNPESTETEDEEEEDEDDDLGDEDPLASPEWHREMLQKARGVVQELRLVPHPTVRRMLLLNYAETVAHFLFGVEAVAPFFLQCLVHS